MLESIAVLSVDQTDRRYTYRIDKTSKPIKYSIKTITLDRTDILVNQSEI